MSVNWQHVDQQEPKKDQVILVIDSWNIAENDEKAQFKDNGHDSQTFLSLL